MDPDDRLASLYLISLLLPTRMTGMTAGLHCKSLNSSRGVLALSGGNWGVSACSLGSVSCPDIIVLYGCSCLMIFSGCNAEALPVLKREGFITCARHSSSKSNPLWCAPHCEPHGCFPYVRLPAQVAVEDSGLKEKHRTQVVCPDERRLHNGRSYRHNFRAVAANVSRWSRAFSLRCTLP